MPKRKKNQSNSALWWLALIGLAVVAGLGYYAKFGPANRVPAELAAPKRVEPVEAEANEPEVRVMTPSYAGDKLQFTEAKSKPGTGENPMVFAVNSFLSTSKVVESQARLQSVKVKDGVAYLDFSAAFGQTYGTEDEQTILEGVCRTMGQFKSVDRVQFLVQGKPLDTLGNVELTEPIPVIR
jgi:hypothetical protein